ncbi:MAG: hypothetical protein ABJN26_16100 [Stappiaceae bacterium]
MNLSIEITHLKAYGPGKEEPYTDLAEIPDHESSAILVEMYIGSTEENEFTPSQAFWVYILSGEARSSHYHLNNDKLSKEKVIKLPTYTGAAAKEAIDEILKRCDVGSFERNLVCLGEYFCWLDESSYWY